MAVDPWAIDAASNTPAYSAQDARLTTVTPFLAGAGASLGVRSGVRPSGSGTDLLVQAQSSPDMTVKVNPGACAVQGAISALQGAYSWALDAVTTLTIAASHASLDRTDLVCIRVRDGNVDTSGQYDASVVVITGTAGSGVPTVPTDATYMVIAQISVVHAVASITGGAITDKRPFLAAVGGVITCTSTTRPAGVAPGQQIYETDTGRRYVYNGSAGGYIPNDPVYVCTSSTRPTGVARYVGMEIYETDTKKHWTWDGTWWRPRPGTAVLAVNTSINVTNLDNGLRSVWTYSWTPPCPGTYEIVAITPTDGVAGEEAKFWLNIASVNFDDDLVRFFSNAQVSQVRLGIGKRYNVTSTAAIGFGVNSQRNQGGSFFNVRAGNRYITITYCGPEGIPANG